ncbi:hypothetical protein PCK1_001292 [Pneumocystis canis]|nr:hypothetical protein PCK1_001292 [Pneumocystis canis]
MNLSKSSSSIGTTRFYRILVHPRQKENPILKHIHNVPWEYGNSTADYILGTKICALFLSLRYHLLYPEYIYHRLQHLDKSYQLRLLLVLVDSDTHEAVLLELNKIYNTYAMISNFRSIKRAINADKEEILMIGGWGEQKASRFKKIMTQPFVIKDSEK